MTEFLVEEWCHIPPIEFQTLVESMPRHIEAVLAARGGPMALGSISTTANLFNCFKMVTDNLAI
jgi:hypothetical protein